MYIWTGCCLPEAFAEPLRRQVEAANRDLQQDLSGFTLPQHISLKISFEGGDATAEILDAIEGVLRQEKEFYVNPIAIEQKYNCLWVAFQAQEQLTRLHETLDSMLESRFGIPRHLYDQYFQFHSTLCLGQPEKLLQLLQRLGEVELPETLKVDTFAMGVSESGKSGTYRVARTVKV